MSAPTSQKPAGMVARALDAGDEHSRDITASEAQRTFIGKLVEACELLITNPERFPELYGKSKERWPDRRTREGFARLMASLCRTMDSVDRRCGLPRRDGSCLGRSYAAIAKETGLGDPGAFRYYRDKRTGLRRKDWRGRRKIGRLMARGHLVGFLERDDRKPEQQILIKRQKPRNERFLIDRGPFKGRWCSYPTVRKIGVRFLKAVKLDRTFEKDAADVRAYRQGRLDHFVDVHARRRRDREIKLRQRTKAREQRIYYVDQAQALAAKTAKKTE
jgi:hypothetical protein